VRVAVLDGAVLGENRNAAFALKVVTVHDTFSDLLVFTEGARLAEELINQGGLAVVNVGNDRNIADSAAHGIRMLLGG